MLSLRGFLAAASLLGAAGCSGRVAPARVQPTYQLDLPGYDTTADAFSQAAPSSFQGSTMLFAPGVTAQGLNPVVQSVTKTREAKAAWLAFKIAEIRPRLDQVANLEVELQKAERQARQSDAARQATEDTARHWIGDQWDALGKARVLAEHVDRAHAEAVFGRYCEAKIWELATSPLATSTYNQRPTPLILCEPFFEQRGLFAGPSCAAAPAGQSYFRCLWREGVLKTSYFAGRYAGAFDLKPDEVKQTKIAAWVDDGTLLAVLTSDNAPKLVNAALAQDKLRVSSVLGREYKDAFVPNGGTPTEAPELALADASPAMLVSAMEDGKVATTPPALKLSLHADLPADAEERLRSLHADVQVLAERPSGAASSSDYLFNRPTVALPEPASLSLAKARPSFQPLFAAISPADRARLKDLAGERTDAANGLKDKEAEADGLFLAYTNALSAGAIAASADGVGEALWIDSSFDVEPLADTAGFRVTLHLSGASAPAELCLDAQTTNELPCPEDGADSLLVETNPSSHAAHDPGTGKIVLETSLDNAEPFGFRLAENHQPGSGDAFSLLGPTDVKGRVLRFELYPNRLHNVLSYYSGELQIIGTDGFGHEVLEHQGATNLMAN